MSFKIEIFIGRYSVEDQPSINLEIKDLEEAIDVAKRDLEMIAIKKSLMTTHSYLYAAINPSGLVNADIPLCLVSYKPTFQFVVIKNKKEIREFTEQFI